MGSQQCFVAIFVISIYETRHYFAAVHN